MAKTRVGVIGIGHIGSFHVQTYAQIPEAQITFLSDIKKEKASKIAAGFEAFFSTDYKKAIGKVDAVSIATPTLTHFEIAEFFLKNGVDVLIEKPITTEIEQAERLISIAEKRSRILQVGHIERFNKAISAIKNIPGEIKFIECHRIGPFSARCTDVSVVLDLMIHDIDIILELIPHKIKNIQATGLKVVTDYSDIANTRLTFANNTICNITSSRVSDDALRKIRIFKDNCYISLDYKHQEVKIYRKTAGQIQKKQIPIKKEQPLKLELKNFLRSVKKRIPPEVSGQDAKRALQIALKIDSIISKSQ